MKKVFLFLLTSLLSLSIQAKVGLLIPDSRSTAETAAATWFASQYGSGNEIAMDAIPTTTDVYTTIWVMVDRTGLAQGEANLPFTAEQKTALKNFVKAGGHLMLTNHATQLVNSIGRCSYAPGIYGSGEGGGNVDVWGIQAVIGETYDHRSHAIYSELSSGDYTYGHPIFPLIGNCHKMDHNCMWDLNSYGLDQEPNVVKKFEDLTHSIVLGTWQHVVDFCCAGIVEFLPENDYRGTILANGMAAYDWQASARETDNLTKLTTNSLNYLESLIPEPEPEPDPTADIAYLLPASISDAEKIAANWFKTEYIGTGKPGKFISDLSNLSGIKVLWINIENTTTSTGDFSETDATALANFVKDGGHLLLTKKATYWAYKTGRINYAPNFYNTGRDPQQIVVTNLGIDLEESQRYDRSSHELFSGLEKIDGPKNIRLATSTENSYCGWQDYKYSEGEVASATNREKVRATNFETRWNADALAVEGGIGDYCYGNIILFNGDEDVWSGAILAIGASAYMWKEGNGHIDNVKALTSNALTLLRNTQPVKPAPDPCSNCFRITF